MLKHGNTITIFDEEVSIHFSEKLFTKPMVYRQSTELLVYRSEEKPYSHKEILTSWLKDESKKGISRKAEEIAPEIGVSFNRISVKDQSTRWGSCSSKKNLNFNWRMIFMPVKISDYIIIHELSHLREMNHSKNFWVIVEEFVPDYKVCRKWLRENERNLRSY